ATATSGIGPTAAWSRNAQRRAIGKCARNAGQSIVSVIVTAGRQSYNRKLRLRQRPAGATPVLPAEDCIVFVEPERTAYDVNFRLFRFPVRIHPWFWIATLVLSASAWDLGLLFVISWVVVVFVSILVHELGHALAFRAF